MSIATIDIDTMNMVLPTGPPAAGSESDGAMMVVVLLGVLSSGGFL